MNAPTHTTSEALSRRDALKSLAAGTALLGLGLWQTRLRAETAPVPTAAAGPFVLPPLPYAFDALEPHIDARTMEIHHDKHHKAYVDNANKALAAYPDVAKLGGDVLITRLSELPESIRTTVRNNLGGHLNHSLFWTLLAPAQGGAPSGQLAQAIAAEFGSFENFKKPFADAAMKRFGSGWAWLVVAKGKLAIRSSANQDSPLIDGETPVLGIDVWEHAYYLKYQNRRADYVAAFWNVVNWPKADQYFQAAMKM